MKRLSGPDSNKLGARLGRVALAVEATLLLGALLLGLSTIDSVAHAGKPIPPPPVYYDVVDLGEGTPHEMNDAGIMVGHSHFNDHAYRFDLLTGRVDLNVGATWVDLRDSSNPTDWIAVDATGINNSGEIVGYAQNTLGETRAYYFDGISSFRLLPGPAFTGSQVTLKINDLGTICAADGNASVIVYSPDLTTHAIVVTPIVAAVVDINNDGVVIATNNAQDPTSVRFVLGVSGFTTFPHCALRHMSDEYICGVRAASGKVKGGPIRLAVNGTLSAVQPLTSTNYPMSAWAGGVNNNGDVVINATLVLYKDGVSLRINDLIAPSSRTFWAAHDYMWPSDISERIAFSATEGFGMMGFQGVSGGISKAILLIPRKP